MNEVENSATRAASAIPSEQSADARDQADKIESEPDYPFYIVPRPPLPGITRWSAAPC